MLAEIAVFASAIVLSDPPKDNSKQVNLDLITIEENIIRFTNLERKRYSLPDLVVDPKLMESARKHTAWMTRSQALQHTRAPVAENIAMGQRTSREVVRCWMNSPGHRANMLNRTFRRIGVAAYRTGRGTIYWCQQFRH